MANSPQKEKPQGEDKSKKFGVEPTQVPDTSVHREDAGLTAKPEGIVDDAMASHARS